MTAWTREDSADLDRQIRRLRELERKQRQAALPKAIRDEPVQTPRPRPTPHRMPSGRWRVRGKHNGKRYDLRFNTRFQAEAWIDRLKEGN